MTVFLVGGVAAIALGVWFVLQGRRRSRSASEFADDATLVQGVVTDLRARVVRGVGETMSGSYWVPVVRFSLPDGEVVEAETTSGSNPAPAQIGETIAVHVDPADPRRIALAQGLARPGTVGCGITAIGWLFVVLGAIFVGLWFLVTVLFGLPV